MTRTELVTELAASAPNLRQQDAELIVMAILDRISSALAQGGRVELRGFGTFTVKRRNARAGRDPRSGEAVSVGEKALPFFKAGRKLRARLNRQARR